MALDLNDKTSNGNTLTNNGAAEGTADTPFAASTKVADFEAGDSDYMTAADSASLSLSGDFTLECWIKMETLGAFGIICKSDRDPGSGKDGYRMGLTVTGQIFVEVNQTTDDSIRDLVTWDLGLNTGTWYHIAISCDISEATATTFVLYKDGVSQGNGTTLNDTGNAASINNNDVPLHIGSEVNGGSEDRFFDGLIDEVRIWNDVRSGTEIADNYNIELTGSEANLVAYYPFEALATTNTGGFFNLF